MTGFIEDSKPADALWALILRSQVYCGEIEDIICPKVPKDITIISAEDIPGTDFITVLGDKVPVLAGKRVNYAGEPILLIAGPELDKIRSFALQITVTYKPEKPSLPDDIQKDIVFEKNYSLGKPDKIFKKAFQIIEGEYITPWQEHHISDAGGALAVPERDTVRIQCPSAWLFHVRDCVADACKIPRQKVIVEQSKMSASFDGRIWYPSLLAVHAALLARKTGKPVFLLTPRDEELAYTPKRLPVTCKLKTAVDPDGNLLAIEAEALVNTGAYAVMTEELSFRLACGIKGIYKCDNFSISVKCYRTNYPPFNTFRGLAAAQGFFAEGAVFVYLPKIFTGRVVSPVALGKSLAM